MAVLMTRQTKGAAQRTLRRSIDVALAILLLVQMCYQLLPEDFHALLGVVMTVVAAVDHETPHVGGLCSLIANRTTAERSAEAPSGAVP